jgi:hypothetical protein
VAAKQKIQNTKRERGLFALSVQTPFNGGDFQKVASDLSVSDRDDRACPAANKNDLCLVKINRPFVLHFIRNEQCAVEKRTVNAKSERGGNPVRSRWLLADESRAVIAYE